MDTFFPWILSFFELQYFSQLLSFENVASIRLTVEIRFVEFTVIIYDKFYNITVEQKFEVHKG